MTKIIAVVSREMPNIDRYTSGQEFYLKTLINILKKINIYVDIVTINSLIKSSKKIYYDIIHLYYVGLADVFTLRRLLGSPTLIYHVYHVEDATWSAMHTLSWKLLLTAVQPLVKAYLATSRGICNWLRLRTPLPKCILVEPYVDCSKGVFHKYLSVIEEKFQNIRDLKLVYIGRINQYRFQFTYIINILKKIAKHFTVKLVVASKISKNSRTIKFKPYSGIEVTILDRWLGEEEKAKLLNEAHFFLFPAQGNTAMNPPITILESVCHGALPIVTPIVLKDLDIPQELVMYDPKELPRKVLWLIQRPDIAMETSKLLKKRFSRFYDEIRFIKSLKGAI